MVDGELGKMLEGAFVIDAGSTMCVVVVFAARLVLVVVLRW